MEPIIKIKYSAFKKLSPIIKNLNKFQSFIDDWTINHLCLAFNKQYINITSNTSFYLGELRNTTLVDILYHDELEHLKIYPNMPIKPAALTCQIAYKEINDKFLNTYDKSLYDSMFSGEQNYVHHSKICTPSEETVGLDAYQYQEAEELYEKVKKIYSYFDPNGFNYKNYNLLISDIKEYTDANYKREALNL